MTIPLFCGDARRSLVIRRGMDSYGEEGSPDETSFTALNERITGDWGLGTGDWGLGIGDWEENNNSARAKRPATANSTQHFQGRKQDSAAVAIRLPPAFVDKSNHPVPLISENLQPALDEVFHARS
ncbi:hypothetical protein [Nostoc sp.]|uniref:hypothetical protein n=1 Tax=Nostoc sp. TaxID=1180 RepID=UPI002FFA081F